MSQFEVDKYCTQTNQPTLTRPASGQEASQFPHVTRKDLTQCQWCYKSAQEPGITLSRCAGCQRARFCSKACQKAAWPTHKIRCRVNMEASKRLPNAQDVWKKLSTFCARHRPSFFKHGIQALDLANDPERRLRDILVIDVIPVVDEEGNSKSSRLFHAFEARVKSIESFPPERRDEMKLQMKLFEEDQRRTGGMGGFLVMVFDRLSGVANVCPMGFPKDILKWERGLPWKEPLLDALNAPLTRLEKKQRGFKIACEAVPMPE
uniref:MYND-type domain-containing protein n=1 Tax=Psilocybe cubensis TaxID=181762 RepID=A0A8H8CJ84_PSICU